MEEIIWNDVNITDKIDITGGCWVTNILKSDMDQVVPDMIKDLLALWEFDWENLGDITYWELYSLGGSSYIIEDEGVITMRSNLYRVNGSRFTDQTQQELLLFLNLFCHSVDDISKECPIEQEI